MKSRSLTIIAILLGSMAILALFAGGRAGNGGLEGAESPAPPASLAASPASPRKEQGDLFSYYNMVEKGEKFALSMHVLEIDPANPNLFVRPATSHQTLFGFAYLSDMDKRWNALASVNGGFSQQDGHPGGLYSAEGKLMTTATEAYPALFMDSGRFFISDVKSPVWLEGCYEEGGEAGGKGADVPDIRLEKVYYNQYPKGEGLYVFTPDYGSQNRIETSSLTAVVLNGEVRGLISNKGSYEIPKDGFLVSAIGEYSKKRLKQAVKPGMHLEIKYEIIAESGKFSDCDWAYECGSWILKDGQIVVPSSDTWVGTLEIRTPRTAVGVKEDGTLVFIVVDGRQKGLSDGLTGKELALQLLGLGIKDAAFLDGGASSEMIIEGKIVNSPSAGRERMLATCFVVTER